MSYDPNERLDNLDVERAYKNGDLVHNYNMQQLTDLVNLITHIADDSSRLEYGKRALKILEGFGYEPS